MANHVIVYLLRHPGYFLAISLTITACCFLITVHYRFIQSLQNDTFETWTADSSLQNASSETRLVLLWSPLFSGPEFLQEGKRSFDKTSCVEKRCEITFDRNRLMKSDAVLFHLRTMSMTDIPAGRLSRQKWIFFSLEAPPYSHFHGLAFMRDMFNWTMTYRKDSDIFIPYGKAVRSNASSFTLKGLYSSWKTKSRMSVWMVSHCATDGQREKYVQELRRHLDVVTYGECGIAVCSFNKTNDCLEKFSKQFFFYLSFENAICNDYITEKFYRTLNHDMIPVVFGGGDYSRAAPAGSYINAMDFFSPKELANHLRIVASNFSLFADYFKWRVEGYGIQEKPDPCPLCEKLQSKSFFLPSVYHDVQKWWITQSFCREWIGS